MNKSILFLALVALPLSLSAQTKPAARKSATPARRSSASHSSARRTTAHPMMMAKAPAAAPAKTSAPAETAPVVDKPVAATTTDAAPVIRQSAPPAKAAPVARTRSPKAPKASSGESAFRIGLRAGAGASTATGISTAELGGGQLTPVMGFHGGLVISIGRGAFTVQPEILYAQYGVRVAAGSDYVQFKYNTVEVPVMLKYAFGQGNPRFFVNAGPTATYLLGGTLSAQLGGEAFEGPMEIGPNDGRINYGGSAGVGVALGPLQVEARGTYLTSSKADGQLIGGKLSLSYLLPIGR